MPHILCYKRRAAIGKTVLAWLLAACAGAPAAGPGTGQVRSEVAQVGPAGILSGLVVDSTTGSPLAGVIVAVPEYSAASAHDGMFELKLPVGTYRVVFWKSMFDTIAAENVKVDAEINTRIRVALTPGEDDVEMLGDAVVPPVFVSGPDPQGGSWRGLMVVRCIITVDGDVRECKPKKGQPLDLAVIRSLQARKYRPATRHGKPLEVWYTFRIRFG